MKVEKEVLPDKKKYTDTFKRMVAREALNGISCLELAKKYNLPHFNTVTIWKRQFRHQVEDMDSIKTKPMSKEDKQSLELQIKRNQELEKALSNANLKIAGLETMIDIAEKELGVSIKKKSGTKQSKP